MSLQAVERSIGLGAHRGVRSLKTAMMTVLPYWLEVARKCNGTDGQECLPSCRSIENFYCAGGYDNYTLNITDTTLASAAQTLSRL